MKKRVNAIEKAEFKSKIAERTYQLIAISGLLAAIGLSIYGTFVDKNKNKENDIEEDKSIVEEKNKPSETTATLETEIQTAEPIINLDNNYESYNLDFYNNIIEENLEYREVRVKAVTNHVYEVPTGFKINHNVKGEIVGVKTLNKIQGYEDYVYQMYPKEEGYKIVDHGAYYEIIVIPKEYISYSVPEGYELVEAEDGNYYGIKMVASPIVKSLS